jgi:hypothetical protein
MKPLRFALTLSLVCLVSLLILPLPAADFSVQPGVPLPSDVPDGFKAVLKPEGVAVKDGEGKVVAEYWTRGTPFSGNPASGLGVRMATIPEGAVMGLLRLPEQRSDFREQSIPPGIYSLRYALHPADGNHMGVAPSRDFAAVVPLRVDADPAQTHPFPQLVALSLQVGNSHPTVIRLELPEGNETPHLWQNDFEHWVLDLDVAGEVVGFVVYGHSAE